MGKNTNISWCDHTWNPWQGCQKISIGCLNCYMFREKKHWGQNPTIVVRSSKQTFYAPLKWNKQVHGNYICGRPLVFVCSWSDFFIGAADAWRDEAMEIMANCQNLIFLILTKRPERILPWLDNACYPSSGCPIEKFPKNVWLGVSVENDNYLSRLGILYNFNVNIKFLSYEPALGQLYNLNDYLGSFDWLISGGESCSDRWTDVNWIRQVRDFCCKHEIPFFHKQNGGYHKIDGAYGRCELDGVMWHQYPKIYYR